MNDERPTKRSECEGGVRPCPWLSCRYNLAADKLSKQIANPKMTDDQVATALVKLRTPTCALDVADSAMPLTAVEVGRIVGLTSSRVKQIVAECGPRIEKEFASMGRRFADEDQRKKESPPPVRAPFTDEIKKKAVAILEGGDVGAAAEYIRKETGRRVRYSQIRVWKKTSDRKKAERDPWDKLYKPRGLIRRALRMYREKRGAGLAQRKAANEISEALGVKVSWAALERWDNMSKEHGEP